MGYEYSDNRRGLSIYTKKSNSGDLEKLLLDLGTGYYNCPTNILERSVYLSDKEFKRELRKVSPMLIKRIEQIGYTTIELKDLFCEIYQNNLN